MQQMCRVSDDERAGHVLFRLVAELCGQLSGDCSLEDSVPGQARHSRPVVVAACNCAGILFNSACLSLENNDHEDVWRAVVIGSKVLPLPRNCRRAR
ncbi:unnamed protein product [Calypogeia fissa]